MSDELHDYRYAWLNGWRWVGYYVRRRRGAATIRQAWSAYVRGYIGESCQQCGRGVYFIWHSPDRLWGEVTGIGLRGDGIAGGLYCPRCFDERAARKGLVLKWRPELLVNENVRTWDDVFADDQA